VFMVESILICTAQAKRCSTSDENNRASLNATSRFPDRHSESHGGDYALHVSLKGNLSRGLDHPLYIKSFLCAFLLHPAA
jgi:hypothetical protein